MSKKTATFMGEVNPDARARQKLWRLSEPMEAYSWDEDEPGEKYDYVITSATVAPYSGPETYIFGSDEHGEILNWGELPGSQRGHISHEEVLREEGYEVIVGEVIDAQLERPGLKQVVASYTKGERDK